MPSQLNFLRRGREFDEAVACTLNGFRYRRDLISDAEEQAVLARVQELPFRDFEFHGYLGKRRVVSFGWRYEFSGGGKLSKADAIPEFLLPLRDVAAHFAEVEPDALQHVLVSEYAPGAGIGWHRDKPEFDQVVGISLLSECILRFRRKVRIDSNQPFGREVRQHTRAIQRWERMNILAQPRSAYHLTGPARGEWQHSISRVSALRYSITFRSMR